MGKRPTARMRAQEPCNTWCKGSRHLHIEHESDCRSEITLVGYGQDYDDQYLSIWVGARHVVIRAPELRALARGIILNPKQYKP